MEDTAEIDKEGRLSSLKMRANKDLQEQREASYIDNRRKGIPLEYIGDIPFGEHEKMGRRPDAVQYALLVVGGARGDGIIEYRGIRGHGIIEYMVQTGKSVRLTDALTIYARKAKSGRETSDIRMRTARYIEIWYDKNNRGQISVGKSVTFSPDHDDMKNISKTIRAEREVRDMIKKDTRTLQQQLRELTPNKIIDKLSDN